MRHLAAPPVHFFRYVLAHAGKSGRRVVSAFIPTAFAQETAEVASVKWRAWPTRSAPQGAEFATIMTRPGTRKAASATASCDMRPTIPVGTILADATVGLPSVKS
jgi:hypothetical protein